jgi:glycyl-tRNA synthetase
LWGIANRSDYDLKVHMEHSGKDLYYLDPITNKKIVPYVIEPSVGVERLIYALICDKYEIQQLENNETREILHIPYEIAPYQVAILPLVNKLNDQARQVFEDLINLGIVATFDTSGSIGKRYRRQDAIGTPKCVTFDFESLETNKVTIRDRETMQQIRVKIEELKNFFV